MIIDDKDIAFISPVGVLRVNRNDVEQGGEGGMISIVADNSEDDTLSEKQQITGVTTILNFRKDAPMRDFPFRRGTMDEERYTLVVIRVPRAQQARTLKAKAAAALAAADAKEETQAKKVAAKEEG